MSKGNNIDNIKNPGKLIEPGKLVRLRRGLITYDGVGDAYDVFKVLENSNGHVLLNMNNRGMHRGTKSSGGSSITHGDYIVVSPTSLINSENTRLNKLIQSQKDVKPIVEGDQSQHNIGYIYCSTFR